LASDQTVTAKHVLQAQLELQRLGTSKAMAVLEATEPDLTEYLLETTTNLYHQVLDTGASAKQARRIHENTLTLVLVCVNALQKAHADLWQEGTGRDVARKLEPPPEYPEHPKPPTHPPANPPVGP
jgi:hypothetical protein